MKIINVDIVLTNILVNRDFVEISTLKEIIADFYKIDPQSNIYFDISSNTLTWAVQGRPDLFEWPSLDDRIHRVGEITQEYVDNYFNWRITKKERDNLVKVCKI